MRRGQQVNLHYRIRGSFISNMRKRYTDRRGLLNEENKVFRNSYGLRLALLLSVEAGFISTAWGEKPDNPPGQEKKLLQRRQHHTEYGYATLTDSSPFGEIGCQRVLRKRAGSLVPLGRFYP